jgi:hypothetical protein
MWFPSNALIRSLSPQKHLRGQGEGRAYDNLKGKCSGVPSELPIGLASQELGLSDLLRDELH